MRYSPNHTLYTVAEISAILKLSTLTIYKYIKEKKLQAVDLGGHYRITGFSLQKFIDEHTTHDGREEQSNAKKR